MSLDQYNNLMSNILNQRCALAKLRAELKEREGRLCRQCKRFGHLTWKCRSGKEKAKKMNSQNKFEVLKSQVMQCGVREIRWQKVVKERVKYFRYGEKGHKTWEYTKMKEKKREEAGPPRDVWEKLKEHCGTRGLPLQGAVMSMER